MIRKNDSESKLSKAGRKSTLSLSRSQPRSRGALPGAITSALIAQQTLCHCVEPTLPSP